MIGHNHVHKFVERMTSNASNFSGISGFSDDDIVDDDDVCTAINASSLHQQEPRQFGLISPAVYLAYIRSGGIFQVVLFLIVSLLFESTKVGMDFLLRDWSVANEESSSHFYVVVYFALSSLVFGCSCLANLLSQSVCSRARRKLHSKLLTHVLRCPVDFFESFSVARIVNRLSGDIFVVDQKLSAALQRLTLVTFICMAAVAVNVVTSPWSIVAVVPMLAFYFWLQQFYRKTSLELQRLHNLSRLPVISQICDTLGGLLTIRAFSIEQRFVAELCVAIDRSSTSFLLLQTSARWLGLVLDLVGTLFVFICLVIGLETADRVETVAMSVNFSLLVPIYLAWVVKFFVELETHFGAVERIVEYFSLETEVNEAEATGQRPHNDLFRQEICFDNVGISHWQEPRVVVRANFRVPSQQKIGICGRSGSGKSTLLMALVKTTKVSSGLLTIGGQNIGSIPIDVLRQNVMAVPQDCCIFAGSIRDNVDPHKKFSDSEIWKCLENVGISAWVRGLKGQLEAEVDHLGENFLKSEKQLLNLARIVLHQPSVVLLDEATNGLDAGDEVSLHRKLLELLRQSTVLTVTHRIATVVDYDRVLVVGDGKILEDGNPKELLKTAGFFASLWKASGAEMIS